MLIRLFCAKNRLSRQERLQPANEPFLEFTKKFFPATESRFLKDSSLVCSVCYLSFSVIFSFLLTISSTPRGVCQNRKSPSHFVRASSHIPYYSTGMGRVGFFSSLFAKRTSKTPFL